MSTTTAPGNVATVADYNRTDNPDEKKTGVYGLRFRCLTPV